MELTDAFAFTLKKYRKHSNLSQEALAHSCGLDRTYIGLLERSQRQPSLSTIFKLAAILKVNPHNWIKEIEELIATDSMEQ